MLAKFNNVYSIPSLHPILYISPVSPFNKIVLNALDVSYACKNACTFVPSPNIVSYFYIPSSKIAHFKCL